MIFVLIFVMLMCFHLLKIITDDYFVVSLDKIAERLKLSNDAAGATLMAVGSSAPELFVSLIAIFIPGEHAAIGMGTIVGSSLFNVLVIIGGVAIVRKTTCRFQTIIRDLLFYIVAVLMLFWVLSDNIVNLWEALLMIAVYIIYVIVVVKWKNFVKEECGIAENQEVEEEEKSTILHRRLLQPIEILVSKIFPKDEYFMAVFLSAIVGIAFLSWVLVQSAIQIAAILEVPEVIVALTVLAVGTSIPDLLSSLSVARQGRGTMGVTNALGSNIFDIFIGMGLPWMLYLLFSDKGIENLVIADLQISIKLLMGSAVLVFLILLVNRWKLNKLVGYILVAIYISYWLWAVLCNVA